MRAARYSKFRLSGKFITSTGRNVSSCSPSAKNSFEFRPIKLLGKGAFGAVFSARAADGTVVAIKKVLQDPHYKNRELDIIQEVNNPYCVRCIKSYKTFGRNPNEVYLNVVMDYMPMSLQQYVMAFRQNKKYVPVIIAKLLSFQLLSALSYLHKSGITHRDIKPQNVLVNPDTVSLKICDFGSAKKLQENEGSIPYIASRFYRAPELVLETPYYTNSIDVWAAACVIGEMLNGGVPLFQGSSSQEQLFEIVQVLGEPTKEELASILHHNSLQYFTPVKKGIRNILPKHVPDDFVELLSSIFVYDPSKRPTAKKCLDHRVFNELFLVNQTLPNGRPFPALRKY